MKVIALLALCVTLFGLGFSNSLDSCEGRCGYGTDSSFSCQCNPSCERYGDCCADYAEVCQTSPTSCKGRCGEKYNPQNKCHCNSKCRQYNNCCSDYTQQCNGGGGSGGGGGGAGGVITDAEIKAISETLYALDSNKASASELIIEAQALVPDSETSSKNDLSSKPLFRYVNEDALFSRPTYVALLAVLDNYQRMTGQAENFSPEQLAEQEAFVKETMSNTELGRELFAFLYTKGVYASEEEFLQDLKMMWFGLYSRYNNKLDSSGFEHIFAGEIKKGKVSGFHNWIQFYLLEKRGQLNYYSHSFDGPWTTFPDVMGMQFMWEGYYKQVGSAVIGCSPEFDFALYSLCYIARPGKQCRLSLGGNELIIQTYTWDKTTYGDGKKFIGSAFPATPRN
ncbi:hypothetical protein INR49_030968 [Caranx melampygus]|nr:hypothetical protein INR49_030968 [Caranx melampygus]